MNNLYPLSGNAIPDAMATDAEVSSAIASHLAATNPHGITPSAIGAASEFYAENLAQDATNAAFAHTNSAIASHLSTSNPHQITPTLIGAAAASHTHTGAQITGNISGNAANVTGVVKIANGGTNATDAPTARTNLGITPANIGAAATSHTHTENRHIILPYRFERLTTQSRIDFHFYLPDTLYCGYILNCIVGGHRGGLGGFLCKREIYLSRFTGDLNFEIITSVDRGSFENIFQFFTTYTSIRIRINNVSSTQRQDFGIYSEIVGSGLDLGYPIFSGTTYA